MNFIEFVTVCLLLMVAQASFANQESCVLEIFDEHFEPLKIIEKKISLIDRPSTNGYLLSVYLDGADLASATELSFIQPKLMECGYIANIQSYSYSSVITDETVDLGNQSSLSFFVNLEPDETNIENEIFWLWGQYLVDVGLIESISFNELLKIGHFSEDQVSNDLYSWSFHFFDEDNGCPIIWENVIKWQALGYDHVELRFGETSKVMNINNSLFQQHYIEGIPEISIATNTNRNTCSIKIEGS